ncbi:N-acetylglucosamine kinase [Streptosporangium pseudovulgare]|uniref:N-acetylglucosamine kinase n=1 Tax=Streptosporangium pseudovulgare TaxID=35765 RepID=A0ABQ2RD43_9ACTN|nr:N-acetylglucosamine kinase [Streptosporangium pseudovulgare]
MVATVSGEVAGRGYGGGSNILSSADPGGSLRGALLAALAGLDPGEVTAGVFGLAGGDSARERTEAVATEAWRAAGLPGRPSVVSDALAAFAGATAEASGAVLIAGTGAVAARIDDRRITGRADGYGWLLGDEGSGTWIGRRAVRAVLASVDGRAAPTALLGRFGGGAAEPEPSRAPGQAGPGQVASEPPESAGPAGPAPSAQEIVRLVHAGIAESGPAWLARLAPAVEAAARDGDAAATAILDEAARRLAATVGALGPVSGPLVLAGSLLTEPTLLAGKVRAGLAGTVVTARDSAAGAAALALHAAGPGAVPDPLAAHRRLIG